jgi:hypothetical protein
MITHSESIQKLAAALVKIAAAVENPHKNAQNPHFRSSYADLAEIINTTRHVCAEHGVALVQSPGMSDGLCTVETLMVHESGEWIRGEAASPIQKQDPQGVGSAITYLRRYSLAALLGIAQEDDDGNTASERRDRETGKPHPRRMGVGAPATDKQKALVERLAKSSRLTEAEREGIHKRLLGGMTKQQASDAIEWLQETIETRDEAPEPETDGDLFGGEPEQKRAPSAQGAGQ